MRISARVDFAVRTLVELARVGSPGPAGEPPPSTLATLAELHDIPPTSLEDILAGLRRADLVTSQRGPRGGWRLARPASEIAIADVIRGLEGPLADVRGVRPDELSVTNDFAAMQRMWIALRSQIRMVLEHVSVQDLLDNQLDPDLEEITAAAGAWQTRRLRADPD